MDFNHYTIKDLYLENISNKQKTNKITGHKICTQIRIQDFCYYKAVKTLALVLNSACIRSYKSVSLNFLTSVFLLNVV